MIFIGGDEVLVLYTVLQDEIMVCAVNGKYRLLMGDRLRNGCLICFCFLRNKFGLMLKESVLCWASLILLNSKFVKLVELHYDPLLFFSCVCCSLLGLAFLSLSVRIWYLTHLSMYDYIAITFRGSWVMYMLCFCTFTFIWLWFLQIYGLMNLVL